MSIKGFPLQQTTGLKQQYATVNPAGKDKYGLDVLPKMVYPLSGVSPLTIQSYNAETGILEITAHGARQGDSLRFIGGANDRVEIPILEIVDANNVKIYPSAVGAIVALTDEVFVMRPINQTADEDGNLVVSVTPGPLAIEIDGVPTTVNVDTGTPANTVRVPVEVHSASGPINITAGDLNVQLSDAGPNFDRTRIGDGTNQWGFNGSSEGLVHDASANAELDAQTALLTTIDADTSALSGTVAAEGGAQPATGIIVGGHNGSGNFRHIQVSNTGVVQVEGPLTDAQLRASAVPVSMASAPLPTGAATETTLGNVLTQVTSIAGEDFATQTTLAALDAKFPSSLGQKNEASSLSVTLSSENEIDLQGIRTAIELVDDTIATDGGAALGKFQTVGGHTGTASHAWHVDSSGWGRVDVRASALPTGAATEASLSAMSGAFGLAANAAQTNPAAVDTLMAFIKGQTQLLSNIYTEVQLLQEIRDEAVAALNSHTTTTIPDTAGGTTITAPAGAKKMIVQNSTQAGSGIRFTISSGTPTASSGYYLEIGQSTALLPAGSIKAISTNAGLTGDVTVLWFV